MSAAKSRDYINHRRRTRVRRPESFVAEEADVTGIVPQDLRNHRVLCYAVVASQGIRSEYSSKMQQGMLPFCILLMVVGLFVSSNFPAQAAPQQGYWSQFDEEDPEALMEIITRLGHTIMRNPEVENAKRGLDLGLSRGFSGSQAAKHLMGLAAANYAGGPGRRRRSEQP